MSDYTKSGYTKTGKKVKSIYDGRVDLTYNEVYDVFIDNKGDEFIIDDVGDKRYWSISDDDYYELVDDVAEATNTTNETKLKFKVGDKVKVVNTEYISTYTRDVKVGDIGTLIHINEGNVEPYRVNFDENGDRDCWWFTDKCIELVSDDTESNYTKTGKKVMCINSNRRGLTYKKVYDVFTHQDGVEFVIDDSGDKRYENIEFPYWCEKSDDTVDTNNNVNTTNETKPKFKVGDKVKVVNTEYISKFADTIKVGHIGNIIYIDKNDCLNPYQVKFDGFKVRDNWWFTDKCIELVEDNTDTIENDLTENTPNKSDGSQIVSDGGSSSYYAQQIPKGMLERFNTTGTIEAKDVIRLFLGNDFNMGNIFKAYCRIISLRNGKGKAGIDEQYDLTKAKYFTEDELNYYLENNNV